MRVYRNSGFTLIEIILVMSIICAVAFNIPPMLQWFKQQGVRHAVEQIRADLQLARMTAIRNRQECAVRFNVPATNQYALSIVNRTTDLKAYRGNVNFLSQGPDGAKMASEIKFNRQGMISTILPVDIFISDGEGLTVFRIRIMLPGGISVYRWCGDHWA